MTDYVHNFNKVNILHSSLVYGFLSQPNKKTKLRVTICLSVRPARSRYCSTCSVLKDITPCCRTHTTQRWNGILSRAGLTPKLCLIFTKILHFNEKKIQIISPYYQPFPPPPKNILRLILMISNKEFEPVIWIHPRYQRLITSTSGFSLFSCEWLALCSELYRIEKKGTA